jgi:hypothetical protein
MDGRLQLVLTPHHCVSSDAAIRALPSLTLRVRTVAACDGGHLQHSRPIQQLSHPFQTNLEYVGGILFPK